MADHDAAGDMRADPQTPPSAAEQPAVEGATGQPEAGSTAPDTESGQPAKEPERTRRFGRTRPGLVLAATVAVALAVVCGLMWNDVRADSGAAADRELFLQAGRQGALNLTTIRWGEVDSNVQRILDGSTGAFRDDFAARAPSFAGVVKQAQSTSEGAITAAGLESVQGDTARVLVAATVKTANSAAAEQEPRAWRMRVTVQKNGDRALVSNVEFVP